MRPTISAGPGQGRAAALMLWDCGFRPMAAMTARGELRGCARFGPAALPAPLTLGPRKTDQLIDPNTLGRQAPDQVRRRLYGHIKLEPVGKVHDPVCMMPW